MPRRKAICPVSKTIVFAVIVNILIFKVDITGDLLMFFKNSEKLLTDIVGKRFY